MADSFERTPEEKAQWILEEFERCVRMGKPEVVHPHKHEHVTVPRRKTNSNGVEVAVLMCLVCGRSTRNIKRDSIPPNTPYMEPEIRERWQQFLKKRVAKLNQQVTSKHAPRGARHERFKQAHDKATSSQYWYDLREKVLHRDNHTCQGCLDPDATGLAVHHITYRNLGCELAYQLVSLCRDCHEKVHFLGAYEDMGEFSPEWIY